MGGAEGSHLLALPLCVSAVAFEGHLCLNDVLALVEASTALNILLNGMLDLQIFEPLLVVLRLGLPARGRDDLAKKECTFTMPWLAL